MADGYRITGAGIFPLQGHSAPMGFAKRDQQVQSRAYPTPPWVALPDLRT